MNNHQRLISSLTGFVLAASVLMPLYTKGVHGKVRPHRSSRNAFVAVTPRLQGSPAEEAARKVALDLVAQSNILRAQGASSYPLSLLLALEALRHYQTWETDQAVREGLKALTGSDTPQVDAPLRQGLTSGYTLSGDGKLLATASDKDVRIWDIETGQEKPGLKHERDVLSVAFSPDGKYIVTGTNQEMLVPEANGIWIWDASTRQRVKNIPFDSHVIHLAFSKSGRYLVGAEFLPSFALSADDYGLWAWEWNGGSPTKVLHNDGQTLARFAAISPDEKYVALAGGFNTEVFELSTGKQVLRAPSGRTVAFSPDGAYVATTRGDFVSTNSNAAAVWRLGQQVPLNDMKPEARYASEGEVRAVAFSPDGNYLAVGGDDGKLRIWDRSKNREVARIGLGGAVIGVAFTSNAKYVAAQTEGRVTLWAWRAQDLAELTCRKLSRNLTPQEWKQYLKAEPQCKTCANLPGAASCPP